MTVLDAYAVIAYLADEAAADDIEPLLEADSMPRLSAVNLAEVVDQLVRLRGMSFDDVLDGLLLLAASGLEVADADLEIGSTAGLLRARHYNRRDGDLSLADCYAVATAAVLEHPLATSDPAIAAVCRYEEIELIPLPDTAGRPPR